MSSAVVFAYHDVGVRCLKTLLARGVEVRLVVTHRDSPSETIWFDSVAATARDHGIESITPDDPNDAATIAAVAGCRPDFLFSFYYRRMLSPALLGIAARGAYNMHGSLLPRYRGRVPVNWAILRGETETGATLHVMTEKPDRGAIVDQQAVPILPDDTAVEVFDKVTVAAEMVLHRSLPALVAGTATLRAQDQSQASYFGGRKPEDGRIDWRAGAAEIHNLVRAVAPPYPGAFCQVDGRTLRILRTMHAPSSSTADVPASRRPALLLRNGRLLARCADGRVLQVLGAEFDGLPLDVAAFARHFGGELGLDE